MSSPTSKNEYEAKKQFLEDLKQLSKTEHEEIFRIIKRNQVEYTENSNGVFFDLQLVTFDVFVQLQKFMELCVTQRANEESRTNEMNVLRQESNSTVA
jgi:hypothetical protein